MSDDVSLFISRLQTYQSILAVNGMLEWRISKKPIAYEAAIEEMETRVEAIYEGREPQLIWFLEHPSIYTGGTSAKSSDLLDPTRFPVHRTGRGGQYTYHGPGQLIAYVMLDLNRQGRDVRCFVHRLEEWVMAALLDWGIKGERREGRPGIWVQDENSRDKKIAALGVRLRRWVSYHGVAVNICPDLSHFEGIVPCGIGDAGVTSISEIKKLKK